MKSFWYTARQAASMLCELTGQAVLPEELAEILSPDELAGDWHGLPLMLGRQYGPMAMRAAQAKLMPQRAEFLTEAKHSVVPPVVLSHYAKGGSGKTSAVVNAAIALAQRGLKVLFIDADPQSSATVLFGVDVNDESLVTLHNLTPWGTQPPRRMADAIRPILENGVLDLVPSDPLLAQFDAQAHLVRGGRDQLFERVLRANDAFIRGYDIIFVDTNPSTTSPLNFVLAYRSDALLMSIPMDALSMKSRRMMDGLFMDLETAGAPLKRVLVLANAFAATTTHGKLSLRDLVRNDRELLMQTVIPFSSAVARQGWERKAGGGLSVVEREPSSIVAKRYCQFALELTEYVLWAPLGLGVLEFDAPEITAMEAVVEAETI